MKDGTTITVGLVLLIIGYVFWYLATWLRIKKASDTKTGFTTGLGLLFTTFGFGLVVDYELLNEYQMLLGILMMFAYMVICLYASDSFITGRYTE